MPNPGDSSKPRVVVLGGCGFIGRNLVHYLISEVLVSHVRVVDKTPPQLAFLNPTHSKTFEDSRVEYRSANLINPASCTSALDHGSEAPWSLVINCAGETRHGQSEAVLAEGILTLSSNVARCCAGKARLVELSSGYMSSSDKPHKEDDPVDPWTVEAKMKWKVEEELKKMAPELDYVIIRPAIVYGIGDRRSLMPRLLLGAIYKHLNEPMKLLWTSELKMNTVHVTDVCRAICHLGGVGDVPGDVQGVSGGVYYIVDEAGSNQGTLANMLAELFGIEVTYYGNAVSTLAKLDIQSVAEEANDKHLTAWASVCRLYDIAHTPLEPAVSPEAFLNKQLCLSGARASGAGFDVQVKKPTVDLLREVLEDYASRNLFPKVLIN